MRYLLLLIVFLLPAQAFAQSVVIDLPRDYVDITTGFTGARVSVYGQMEGEGDLALTIRGPDQRVTVRHKSQVLGLWMNTDSITFRNVPSFYDYAVSSPETSLAARPLLSQYNIGLESYEFTPVSGNREAEDIARFEEALLSSRQGQGLMPLNPKSIVFLKDGFFKASFDLPANVMMGDYLITAYLFERGAMVDSHQQTLSVSQVGVSAKVYLYAYTQSVLYGIALIFMAIAAGWMSNAVLKRD